MLARYIDDAKVDMIFKKISNRVATYEDAQEYSIAIGDILRDSFIDLDISNADVEDVCRVVSSAMRQNYDLSSMVCASVQDNINDIADISYNPVQPPINLNKIEGMQTVLRDAELMDDVKEEVSNALSTYTSSVVDDWIKANVDFQARNGYKPIIVREYEGMHYDPHRKPHWQDCPYCKSLEGTFDYGKEPKNIYKRHEKCKCIVSYYPDKESKGKITALQKGEKDINKILWNTGTGKKRESVARRNRQTSKNDALMRIG